MMNDEDFIKLIDKQTVLRARFIIAVNGLNGFGDDSFKQVFELKKEIEESNQSVIKYFKDDSYVPSNYLIDTSSIIKYLNTSMVMEAEDILKNIKGVDNNIDEEKGQKLEDESESVTKEESNSSESIDEDEKNNSVENEAFNDEPVEVDLGIPDYSSDAEEEDVDIENKEDNLDESQDLPKDEFVEENIDTENVSKSENLFFKITDDKETDRVNGLVHRIDEIATLLATSLIGDTIDGMEKTYSTKEVEELKKEKKFDEYNNAINDIKRKMISDCFLPDDKFNQLDDKYAHVLTQLRRTVGSFQNVLLDYSKNDLIDVKFNDLDSVSFEYYEGLSDGLFQKKPILDEIHKDLPEEPKDDVDLDNGIKDMSVPISLVEKDLKKSKSNVPEKKKITLIKNSKHAEYDELFEKTRELASLTCEISGMNFNDPGFNDCFLSIINDKNAESYDEAKVYKIKENYNYVNDFVKNHKVGYNKWISEFNVNNAHDSIEEILSFCAFNEKNKESFKNDMTVKGLRFLGSFAMSLAPVGVSLGIAGGAIVADRLISKYENKKGTRNWSAIAHKVLDGLKISGVAGLASKLAWPVGVIMGAGTAVTWAAASKRLKNLDEINSVNYDEAKVELTKGNRITGIKTNVGLYFKDPKNVQKIKEEAKQITLMAGSIMAIGKASEVVGSLLNSGNDQILEPTTEEFGMSK